MDADNCALASRLVSPSYINQGAQALATRRRLVKALLSSRRLPARGWDEATIEMLLTVGAWGWLPPSGTRSSFAAANGSERAAQLS
jgi:hypothetical protein